MTTGRAFSTRHLFAVAFGLTIVQIIMCSLTLSLTLLIKGINFFKIVSYKGGQASLVSVLCLSLSLHNACINSTLWRSVNEDMCLKLPERYSQSWIFSWNLYHCHPLRSDFDTIILFENLYHGNAQPLVGLSSLQYYNKFKNNQCRAIREKTKILNQTIPLLGTTKTPQK